MKTILYATDYSKNSAPALKYAQRMAEDLKTRLVIAHVFDYPTVLGTEGLTGPFPNLEETAFESHRSQLEDFCTEHIGFKWKSPNVELRAVENPSVVKGIISVADEWHAQMIVTGMKGESIFKELLMGSVPKHLLAKAPCPVLAIPADAVYAPFQTIVYASDFEEEDVYALQKLAEMAERFDADIKILHITTHKEIYGDAHMDWFKDLVRQKIMYNRVSYDQVVSETVFDSLKSYLDEVGADLIVMLEREKKGFLKKMFHRDLVKKMESYGKVPLLSFRGSHHQLFYFKEAL